VTHLVDDPAVDFIVRGLRLPVAATGIAAGLALGMSGAIFQKLLANPLASPDFVGVSSGASFAAVTAIVFFNASSAVISGSALVGAIVSAALVYVLALRNGLSGYRFILVGIGISEFFLSLVGYVLARAELFQARAAMTWLVGSLGQAGSGELWALVAALVVLLPAALLLERPLRSLELGDDAARALGTRVEVHRLALITVAVVLVAFATAAVGPIVFVALIAGPVARRLLGPAGGHVFAAGLVGASLFGTPLPTGLVTGAVGAPYLVWLLVTANREGRGG
jgi:iron complex transport system permease protein